MKKWSSARLRYGIYFWWLLNAAAERLRRLEDAGVIRGYHAKINPDRLGLSMVATIEMRVNRVDYQRFQKAIQKLGWILECYHVAGRASFYLKAAVPDAAGLELLIGHLGQSVNCSRAEGVLP